MLKLCLLALVGCTPSLPEPWRLGSAVNPGHDTAWTAAVTQALNAWSAALPDCAPVFLIAEDGYPVRRETDPQWPENVIGRWSGDDIKVAPHLGTLEVPVLIHELGHAMGFPHVDPGEDPRSIMHPGVMRFPGPSEGDIDRALALLDCP